MTKFYGVLGKGLRGSNRSSAAQQQFVSGLAAASRTPQKVQMVKIRSK